MLDLGRFPYINTTAAATKVDIDKGVLTLKDGFDSQTISVRYKNDSKEPLILKENEVSVRVFGEDGTAVGSFKLGADKELAAGGVTEIGSMLLQTTATTDNGKAALATGETYTVKAYINGKLQDDVLTVKVLNNDDGLESLKIKGKAVDLTADSLVLELPFTGTDLTKLSKSDVVVVLSDANAAKEVTVTAAEEDGTDDDAKYKATVKVKVTAEDGETSEEYVVTVTKAEANNDVSLKSITVGGVVYNNPTAGESNAIEITLPAGTTKVPAVTAKATDSNAKVEITQAKDFESDNKATVVVTAEDGTTEAKYYVEFTVDED